MSRANIAAALIGAALAPILSWLYVTRWPDPRSVDVPAVLLLGRLGHLDLRNLRGHRNYRVEL